MDKSPRDGIIPLAGRCLWLLTRYALLLARYALWVTLDGLLRLTRP